MHACGHDIHITCLTATVEALAKRFSAWNGTLLAIAQPAEETAEGAEAMLRDGVFRRFPKPDVALGQHVEPLPVGSVGHNPAVIQSAAVNVDIRLFGRGGHASRPQATVDPVVTAAFLVARLQTIVSREFAATDPVVITTGRLQAGTKANIIPDEASITLNVRIRSDAALHKVLKAITRIANAEAEAAGCPRLPQITTSSFFPLTCNDASIDARSQAAHEAVFGPDRIISMPATMGSEDFSAFGIPGQDHYDGEPVPYSYWFFGCVQQTAWDAAPGDDLIHKLDSLPGPHTAEFAPDPRPTLHTGIYALTAAALAFLSS
jgi:hippurate hydrolase